MRGFGLALLILVVTIFYLDALLPSLHSTAPSERSKLFESLRTAESEDIHGNIEHRNIVWKLRPPSEISRRRRLWLRFAANVIRLDCLIKRQEPPLVLCPKGGKAVLEAHFRPNNSSKYEKIGRFLITTTFGPSNQPIQDTVHDLYGLRSDVQVRVGAVIYMFVEEPYRMVSSDHFITMGSCPFSY
jgi:hypothetical protein